MSGDMNFPFEPQDPTVGPAEGFLMSGGVVVMAAMAPTPDGQEPLLIFRFAHADGSGFMHPIALGFDRSQLEDFPKLISQAMGRALEAAGR